MLPPAETILRRRHTARTCVRVAALLCVARSISSLADSISGVTFPDIFTAQSYAIDRGFPIGIWLFVAAVLIVAERPLTRWLIPAGSPANLCLNCGYSLKNLKSPICPECGADVGPRAR